MAGSDTWMAWEFFVKLTTISLKVVSHIVWCKTNSCYNWVQKSAQNNSVQEKCTRNEYQSEYDQNCIIGSVAFIFSALGYSIAK